MASECAVSPFGGGSLSTELWELLLGILPESWSESHLDLQGQSDQNGQLETVGVSKTLTLNCRMHVGIARWWSSPLGVKERR